MSDGEKLVWGKESVRRECFFIQWWQMNELIVILSCKYSFMVIQLIVNWIFCIYFFYNYHTLKKSRSIPFCELVSIVCKEYLVYTSVHIQKYGLAWVILRIIAPLQLFWDWPKPASFAEVFFFGVGINFLMTFPSWERSVKWVLPVLFDPHVVPGYLSVFFFYIVKYSLWFITYKLNITRKLL